MRVTLFNFTLQRGAPVVEQVLFAAIRAILKGEYPVGEAFPSVRLIAANLKIHPNTAHKVVQLLLEQHWLEARVGIGTVVTQRRKGRAGDARELLRADLERLVVKARTHGIALDDLIGRLTEQWRQIDPVKED